MTYAIGFFAFGIDLTDAPKKYDGVIQALIEDEIAECRYNGSGDEPSFIGVEIDQIDEASNMGWKEIVELKDTLKAAMAPGSQARIDFIEKLKAVAEHLEDGVEDEDDATVDEFIDWLKRQQPEVFLTWGSS